MTYRVGGMVVAVAAALLASGCASLADKSAGLVGCKSSDIKISDEDSTYNSRHWTATCKGRDYTCSQVATGSKSSQISCTPTAGGEEAWSSGVYTGPRTSSGATTASVGGSVERAFDKTRELHMVRGKFALTRGYDLKVIGIPQLKLGMIAFVLSVNTGVIGPQLCPTFNVVVNEQPLTALETSSQEKNRVLAIESRFDFESLKPLGQQFATFGAEACGRAFKFSEAQVAELQKFLVIYSQIATQVQEGELPSKEGQAIEATPASSPDGA